MKTPPVLVDPAMCLVRKLPTKQIKTFPPAGLRLVAQTATENTKHSHSQFLAPSYLINSIQSMKPQFQED